MRESLIQTAVMHYLQLQQNMGKLYYIRNNTGAMVNQQGRFVRFGRRGSSDLMVFYAGGRTEFWEIKNEKGKLNPNQLEFKSFIESLGFVYRIIRSVDDII